MRTFFTLKRSQKTINLPENVRLVQQNRECNKSI